MSTAAVARVLGVTPRRVLQLVDEGKLKAVLCTDLGRLFDVRDVERLADERRAKVT